MADPLGILALLIVTAGPSDPSDFVWADDVPNPVQQVSFQDNMADRPSFRPASPPIDVQAANDGMVFASDIPGDDGRVVLGAYQYQDESPFEEELLPAPPQPTGQPQPMLPPRRASRARRKPKRRCARFSAGPARIPLAMG